MILSQAERKTFAAWITNNGGEVLGRTNNEYEIMRVMVRTVTHVAYQSRDGRQTWPSGLEELHAHFKRGRCIPLANGKKLRGKRFAIMQALIDRDGPECFYCGKKWSRLFLSEGRENLPASVEEVCPRQIGGPNALGNQVLACKRCNSAAGNLPVIEKVKLRERMRACTEKFPHKPSAGYQFQAGGDVTFGRMGRLIASPIPINPRM